MEPALPPVGLLQAAVELLEVELRLGAQVQHPAAEIFQPHGEGQGHRRVAVPTGEAPQHLHGVGHLVRAGQIEEAHGDVEAGGGLPVRGGGGQDGGDLLLQLLEAGEDGRGVGLEGDEVRGAFFSGATAARLSLLQRG